MVTSLAMSAIAIQSQSKKRSICDGKRRSLYQQCLGMGISHLFVWTRGELHAVLWALGEKHDEVKVGEAIEIIQSRLEKIGGVMPSMDEIPLSKKKGKTSGLLPISALPVKVDTVVGTPLILSTPNVDLVTQTVMRLVKDLFIENQASASSLGHRDECSLLIRGLLRLDYGRNRLANITAKETHILLLKFADAADKMPYLQAYGGSALFLLPAAVVCQDDLHDTPGAEKTLRQAQRMLEAAPYNPHPPDMLLAIRCRFLSRMGSALRVQGKFSEALAMCKDAYVSSSWLFGRKEFQSLRASCTVLFGVALREMKLSKESYERLREAVDLFEDLARDPNGLRWARIEFVRSTIEYGRFEEADALSHKFFLDCTDTCTRFYLLMRRYDCLRERVYNPRDLFSSHCGKDRQEAERLFLEAQTVLRNAEAYTNPTEQCSCRRPHRDSLEGSMRLVAKKLREIGALKVVNDPYSCGQDCHRHDSSMHEESL